LLKRIRFLTIIDPTTAKDHLQKTANISIAIIAIVAALALFGVVAITIVTISQQQAEARGCPVGTIAPNASKLRCFRP
jgi:hypothetical protein